MSELPARYRIPAERERATRRRRPLTLLLGVVCVTATCLAAVALLGGGGAGPVELDPGRFAPGACVAFSPTAGNRHQTIFLDAGHGGIDPGGVGTTATGQRIAESEINLPIELATMKRLRALGFRVVVSRTRNSTVVKLTPAQIAAGTLSYQAAHNDVADRDVCANLARASLLVGIYMDAGGPQDAGSVTAYDPDRAFGTPAQGGITAAAASYDHLLLLGPASPGYFSTPSRMPGAVIEPLYLTDPFEGSIAANRRDQVIIAGGIARAVEQFMRDGRRRM